MFLFLPLPKVNVIRFVYFFIFNVVYYIIFIAVHGIIRANMVDIILYISASLYKVFTRLLQSFQQYKTVNYHCIVIEQFIQEKMTKQEPEAYI